MIKKFFVLFTVLFLTLNIFGVCNTSAFYYDGYEYAEFSTNDYNLYLLHPSGEYIYVIRSVSKPYYNTTYDRYYTGGGEYTIFRCAVGSAYNGYESVYSGPNNDWYSAYSGSTIIYSSYDVSDQYGNLIYTPSVNVIPNLEWSFSRLSNKTKIMAKTQAIDNISNYTLYYTTDVDKLENYTSLNTASVTADGEFVFSFDNQNTGSLTYYFVLLDNVSGDNAMSSVTVSFESLNEKFDEDYNFPSLQWSFERKDGVITMSSQRFFYADILQYSLYCSQTLNDYDNYKNWSSVDIKSIYDPNSDVTQYYYYITFDAISDINEFTYYFVFEDSVSKETLYSSVTINLESLNHYFDMQIQEEQAETSKSILELIIDFLSYMNPFSENFFAYKLIGLLVDALKGLFIPSDDFFANWLDDLNDYFGDTFGILYYPFEIVIDFFNRIGSLEESNTAILTTPEFKLMDTVLLQSYTYNFYDILQNDTFKTIHTIYLYVVDIILWLGVVLLCRNMVVTFVGGVGTAVYENDNVADERAYKKYSKYRENVSRYNRENNVSSRHYIRKK